MGIKDLSKEPSREGMVQWLGGIIGFLYNSTLAFSRPGERSGHLELRMALDRGDFEI